MAIGTGRGAGPWAARFALLLVVLSARSAPAQEGPAPPEFADVRNGLVFRPPPGASVRTIPLDDRDVHQVLPDAADGSALLVVCFRPGAFPGVAGPRAQFEREEDAFRDLLAAELGRPAVVRREEVELDGAPAYRVEFEGAAGRADLVIACRGDRTYRILFTAPLRRYLARRAAFERLLASVRFSDPEEASSLVARPGEAFGWLARMGPLEQVWSEAVVETPSDGLTLLAGVEMMLLTAAGEPILLRHLAPTELHGLVGTGRIGPDGLELAAGARVPLFLPPLVAGPRPPARLRVGLRLRHAGRDELRVLTAECRREGPGEPLAFPLAGTWLVAWGPDHHAPHRRAAALHGGELRCDQRFALDLVRLDAAGSSFGGNGGELRDYYAFGAEVRAAAAGTVVAVAATHPDLPPGRTDPEHPLGNHVVVRHADGLCATYAHLQQGSVRVRAGEAVAVGAPLGRVGNSGNTSEPHLHFHLARGEGFPGAQGVPSPFRAIEVRSGEGWVVLEGMPPHGAVVRAR